MAVTATLQLLESHVYGNRPVRFLVTFANGGASDVEVSRLVLDCSNGYPQSVGEFRANPGGEATVAAAGTLSYSGKAVFFASLGSDQSVGDQTGYTFSIVAEFSDSTVCTSNSVTAQVEPVLEDTTYRQNYGSLSFDSNNNSDIFHAVL